MKCGRYDHWFEHGLTNVKTEYTLNENSELVIKNIGTENSNEKIITGIGKFKDDTKTGWLRISFFKPFYSDYKIIYLDENYQTVIITSESKDYLWILHRNPKLTIEQKAALILKCQELTFDTQKIIWAE